MYKKSRIIVAQPQKKRYSATFNCNNKTTINQ